MNLAVGARPLRAARAVDASRRRFLAAAAAAIAAFAGAPIAPRPTAPAVHTVVIDGFAFEPALLTVRRGDTVVWKNDDPVPHTATAKGVFDSGAIAPGSSWKYVAKKRGRYNYVCTFHPNMHGTLVVR